MDRSADPSIATTPTPEPTKKPSDGLVITTPVPVQPTGGAEPSPTESPTPTEEPEETPTPSETPSEGEIQETGD